jgi:DegV family protein with EDD domain
VIDDRSRPETEVAPSVVADALRAGSRVSTSRPSPEVIAATYAELADAGYSAIVSVHLSERISGTCGAAEIAAGAVEVPVIVVDSRTVGMGAGFAVLSGAEAARGGWSAEQVAALVRRRAAASTMYFYVDSLEYLRRGGRIGAAAAILGGALAVKPLLCIEDGKVANLERVRTAARALSRLEDLAVEAAGESPVDVCVAHLASPDRAAALADRLALRLADQLEGREVWCGELGAVLGAHVGPGMVAVCVAPR